MTNSIAYALAVLEEVRNYARAGEKEKALDLYRRLKKNYPTTTYGRDADRFIEQLSVNT